MELNFLNKLKQKGLSARAGFTLLEMLIVISLIGILISIGIASYSQAQKKSRDSRRMADMKAVQSGFEQYYADNNGKYPYDATNSGPGGNCPASIESASHAYLPLGYPSDPKNSAPYTYAFYCSQSSFCLCSDLESGTGNTANLPNNPSCSYGIGSYYCVGSLQ